MSADRCAACAGSGEDFNEGDPCHVCHGRGVIDAPAAPEPHIDGWPLYSGLPPAAPAAEPVGWRPIETAPRDGTEVLVNAGNCCYVVAWIADDIEWWCVDDNKLGPFRLRGMAPTHWMPLPAAPRAAPAQSREPLTLTDEQIDAAVYAVCPDFDQWHEGPSLDDIRAIVRAVGIGSREPLTDERLTTFLNAAAGEGLVLDGVDAADLYIALFPERYRATIDGIEPGSQP